MPSSYSTCQSPTEKALKRCLNCSLQKTRCDKTLPTCLNCRKKGRTCLGYSLVLSWPRDSDKRRSARSGRQYFIPLRGGRARFVNSTPDDVEQAQFQGPLIPYGRLTLAPLWFPSLSSLPVEPNLDASVAANRYIPVARLISSSRDADSLYGLLVRLSATDNSLSSLAARYALSALSYQSMRRSDGAFWHQNAAIRALQGAIEAPDKACVMRMMAASMLLSTFESMNFDSSDLSWSIFFCGTKRIAGLVTQQHESYVGDEALIMDWIFYHDVMYKFSIKHWQTKNEDQIQLAAQEKIISKAIFSPERQTVVPIAGCSLELLDLLCQVIDVVHERNSPEHRSKSHLKVLQSLEIRLNDLSQRQSGVSSSDSTENGDAIHSGQVAELYRLATLIYLFLIAKGESASSPDAHDAIEKAFEVLCKTDHCERPWPLFIVGLAAHTEDQRLSVLKVIEKSLALQHLGSMALADRMIRDAWVQQDLDEGRMDLFTLYGQVISRNRVPPCFT